MKIIKRLFLFLLLALCMSTVTFADTYSDSDDIGTVIETKTYYDEDGAYIVEQTIEMTREQAIAYGMSKKGVSYEDEAMLYPQRQTRDVTTYLTRTKTITWYTSYIMTLSVEIGGTWEVYGSGSFRQYNSLHSSWCVHNGNGPYTWSLLTLYSPTTYPATEASLAGRGLLEIAVTETYQDDLSLALFDLGFTYSHSVSGVMYYRATKSVSGTWSLY